MCSMSLPAARCSRCSHTVLCARTSAQRRKHRQHHHIRCSDSPDVVSCSQEGEEDVSPSRHWDGISPESTSLVVASETKLAHGEALQKELQDLRADEKGVPHRWWVVWAMVASFVLCNMDKVRFHRRRYRQCRRRVLSIPSIKYLETSHNRYALGSMPDILQNLVERTEADDRFRKMLILHSKCASTPTLKNAHAMQPSLF
jgi:hypothetical protein